MFTYAAPEAFEVAAVLPDGIHTIVADRTRVDPLVRGVPNAPMIVVFSSGIARLREPAMPISTGPNILQGLPPPWRRSPTRTSGRVLIARPEA